MPLDRSGFHPERAVSQQFGFPLAAVDDCKVTKDRFWW